ncbi:MAG: alpha/beta hydrolase [Wenzhouxiangella sp.]|nr:MAG: alpha/beta hydrolase [Wenzhouxiangella sp.]
MRRSTLILLLCLPLLAFGLIAGWIAWIERHPDLERELRVAAQDQLEEWFPEAMTLPPELIGFQRPDETAEGLAPDLILIHGLDEPGGIWDESIAALAAAGLDAWEFRYPNDQAIDQSADLLAEYWEELASDSPVFLVGHSMGGLLIRDFVTRWRHPVAGDAHVSGPGVAGVILVATPNQGSEWARLRAWLELREWATDIPEGRFSLFASLRDGTGAAKIDLRPESSFLAELNARSWPEDVPLFIIGGRLTEPTPDMLDGLDDLAEQLGIDDLRARVEDFWRETGEGLGDGVVSVASLELEGGPEPVVLPASHRGLLVDLPFSEGDPPAVELIVDQIRAWRERP